MNKLVWRLQKFDWVLLLSAFLLICIGLAAIYSVGLSRGENSWLWLSKQLVALVLGLAAFWLVALTDYQWWRSYARWFYLIGLALLLLVLFFGETIRGTRGWFALFGYNFQPVELVKLLVIVWLARYFSAGSRPLNQFKHLLLSGLAVLAAFGLVVSQPDFGSALVLFLIWFGLVLMIGPRRYQWLIFGVVAITSFLLAWNFFLVDYQKDRLLTFINPSADPLGAGYNVTQSVIAIGAGGLTGRGLSFGSQSQLKFLPEAHTDFVFAVVAEELGWLGAALVLGLFALIFFRLYLIARASRDDFALFLVLGVMIWLFIQLLMNVGMNLGLAPVAGITLPLVSYGGSSLIFILLALGLMESIKLRS